MAYIEFEKVSKIYQLGETEVKALDEASFVIEKGELVLILGQSGSGKSTCMNILGGLDDPSSGSVLIDGKRISDFSEKELLDFRRKSVGFVFQFYNLIQNLTAKENIELGTEMSPHPISPEKALREVGLSDRMDSFPSQLSGGQQQRVSIARALARRPKLLLCDEPTGALDYTTGKQILGLLESTCRKDKITTIIVTHNSAIEPMADRVIYIKNGQVEKTKLNSHPRSVKNLDW